MVRFPSLPATLSDWSRRAGQREREERDDARLGLSSLSPSSPVLGGLLGTAAGRPPGGGGGGGGGGAGLRSHSTGKGRRIRRGLTKDPFNL